MLFTPPLLLVQVRLGLQFFPAGQLTVDVIQARNLVDRERVGKQDPYVQVTLEGECRSFRQKTRVDTDGGNNPVWNQKLQFDVVDHHMLQVSTHGLLHRLRYGLRGVCVCVCVCVLAGGNL